LKQVTIRIALKTGRKLGHFYTAFVVHFYTALDNLWCVQTSKQSIELQCMCLASSNSRAASRASRWRKPRVAGQTNGS
jgi:hypothetical protein